MLNTALSTATVLDLPKLVVQIASAGKLVTTARTITNVALERNVVMATVCTRVCGLAEPLQALWSAQSSSSPSSFPSWHAFAVLAVRITAIERLEP